MGLNWENTLTTDSGFIPNNPAANDAEQVSGSDAAIESNGGVSTGAESTGSEKSAENGAELSSAESPSAESTSTESSSAESTSASSLLTGLAPASNSGFNLSPELDVVQELKDEQTVAIVVEPDGQGKTITHAIREDGLGVDDEPIYGDEDYTSASQIDLITGIDILEEKIYKLSPKLLKILLKDQTKSYQGSNQNIFWATTDYSDLGKGYQYHDAIEHKQITGKHSQVIRPRILKEQSTQSHRSRDMAEVFTAAWICNEQINLIDEQWFGRPCVFNTPFTNRTEGHGWVRTDEITFPAGKTWQDYVKDVRLEMACGEAPYLVSRYDAATGQLIALEDRIGILDRKLRVVSENTTESKDWLHWATCAYQSVYGYEWHGDSLLLARESLLISFAEYYHAKFDQMPSVNKLCDIAEIIAWNLWQMDGLKGVIPDSCTTQQQTVLLGQVGSTGLFGLDFGEEGQETQTSACEGCAKNDMLLHNGIYCLIKDWFATDKPAEHDQNHQPQAVGLDPQASTVALDNQPVDIGAANGEAANNEADQAIVQSVAQAGGAGADTDASTAPDTPAVQSNASDATPQSISGQTVPVLRFVDAFPR